MPADFSLSESVSCQNLYSGKDLDCSVNSSKKVLVKVFSNRETNSQVSFMAVGLRVGPIYNPDKIIDSAESVSNRIKDEVGIDISFEFVRGVMTDEMGMRYRKIVKASYHSNSP